MPARAPSDAPVPGTRFATADDPARVAVLVVTYNSADDVDGLLAGLRPEADQVPLRVLVADNGSTDGTLARLAAHTDVHVVDTGANLGYAGGINRLLPLVGDVEAVLVLNPDLTVRPGAVRALLAALDNPRVGAVVPCILEPDGTAYPSLRREPTVLRTLGDALVGRRFPGRPTWASETDRDPAHYTTPHAVDWATGAALLVRADTARQVGPWDEQYFLYSEETDYCRRLREAGQLVWFEPAAQVIHARGGSGSSPALVALQEANRVRYAHTHGSPLQAGAVRAVLLLKSGLRARDAGHRAALRTLLDGPALRRPHPHPGARPGSPAAPRPSMPGSVVIPAHDEEHGIARTLAPLAQAAAAGTLEVVVVANGCTDATAAVARSVPGVHVVEIDVASKAAALRAGDRAATRFPGCTSTPTSSWATEPSTPCSPRSPNRGSTRHGPAPSTT
ncbi:glycosyltransferase family 2 protein [Cellulomonas soli]